MKENAKLKSLQNFITQLIQRAGKAEISNNAKVLTYYILFSIFPLLIFVGNLLPLLHLNVNSIMTYVRFAMPTQIAKFVTPIIRKLLTSASGSLLSISALTALWGASRGINSMRASVNKAYQITPQYGKVAMVDAIVKRLIAFVLTFIVIAIIFVLFLAFIFGQRLLEWLLPILQLPSTFLETFQRWKWPIAGSLIFLILWVLYFTLPNAKIKLTSVLPGTLLTATSWLVLSQAFSVYVTRFAKANSYGTLGVFAILLIWMNIIFMLFMFGAVLNAVIEEQRHGPVEIRKLDEATPGISKIKDKF